MQEAILLNNGGPRQQEAVRQLLAAGADPGIRAIPRAAQPWRTRNGWGLKRSRL